MAVINCRETNLTEQQLFVVQPTEGMEAHGCFSRGLWTARNPAIMVFRTEPKDDDASCQLLIEDWKDVSLGVGTTRVVSGESDVFQPMDVTEAYGYADAACVGSRPVSCIPEDRMRMPSTDWMATWLDLAHRACWNGSPLLDLSLAPIAKCLFALLAMMPLL